MPPAALKILNTLKHSRGFSHCQRQFGLAILNTSAIDTASETETALPKIKYLSVAHLFADAIERIYQEISVSKLWQ